jgi:hypothetical protein
MPPFFYAERFYDKRYNMPRSRQVLIFPDRKILSDQLFQLADVVIESVSKLFCSDRTYRQRRFATHISEQMRNLFNQIFGKDKLARF